MFITPALTVLLIVLIALLVTSLFLFLATKYVQRVLNQKAAERYRGKGALLPIANVQSRRRTTLLHYTFPDSFRRSTPRSPTGLTIPEIRITFPEEDVPPINPGQRGQRISRVVVVQVGESGAAYVTPPPAYEGFEDVDVSTAGGLKEKS
jgi:hypothetical protein